MSLIFAMITFAFVMSISPGPVNVITLTSGASRGVLKTLPFVSGATVGFTALLFVLGLGASQLIEQYPKFMEILGICGALFILYMAYKIAMSDGTLSTVQQKQPRFHEGALLQWLNPKAWIACISGIAAFTTQGEFSSLLLFCGLYFFICYVGISFWAIIGAQTRRFLTTKNHLLWFNRVMGGSLGVVGIYLLLS